MKGQYRPMPVPQSEHIASVETASSAAGKLPLKNRGLEVVRRLQLVSPPSLESSSPAGTTPEADYEHTETDGSYNERPAFSSEIIEKADKLRRQIASVGIRLKRPART